MQRHDHDARAGRACGSRCTACVHTQEWRTCTSERAGGRRALASSTGHCAWLEQRVLTNAGIWRPAVCRRRPAVHAAPHSPYLAAIKHGECSAAGCQWDASTGFQTFRTLHVTYNTRHTPSARRAARAAPRLATPGPRSGMPATTGSCIHAHARDSAASAARAGIWNDGLGVPVTPSDTSVSAAPSGRLSCLLAQQQQHR